MNASTNSNPVIVLGMHRSGTSMLSRVLSSFGVFMGKQKNIHDESLFHLQLNDKLLNKTHGFWDAPLNTIHYYENKAAFDQLVKYADTEISSWRYKKKYKPLLKKLDVWGWKDPRNILFIPIYLKIYNGAKFIFIVRNGIDVANSLQQRELKREGRKLNNTTSIRCRSIEHAFRLWEEYNEIYLNYRDLINPDNLLEIKYESLLENPRENIHSVSQFLSIDSNEVDKGLLEEVDIGRMYRFLTDAQLSDLYKEKANSKHMKYWEYDQICINEQ